MVLLCWLFHKFDDGWSGNRGRLSGCSSLEECLREAVHDTLTRLFGSVATESIIEYSISKSLKRKGEESLVENSETFSQALHTILESSYTPVEKLILKDLYSKLGLEYEETQGYKFADYIGSCGEDLVS